MKKLYLFLFLVVSIFLFNIDVKADTFEYDYGFNDNYFRVNSYSELQVFIDDNIEIIQSMYDEFFEVYNASYSKDYPYYIAQFSYVEHSDNGVSLGYYLNIVFVLLKSEAYFGFYEDNTAPMLYYSKDDPIYNDRDDLIAFSIEYGFDTKTISPLTPTLGYAYPYLMFWTNNKSKFYENVYFDSNYDINYISDYHDIIIHDYRNTGEDFHLQDGDVFPTYFKNSQIDKSNYMEINLNDYAYVALSLKNYDQEPFSTNVRVKGNYCITPVYNYGMTEKKDLLIGSQAQRCSPYYDDYTLVRTYILEQDLKNNAIYYLKSYNTSKDNYVIVDTNIFNVTLITEDEKDNPYVTINGKTYPTIPYDSLTDTATKSEDEGYNSGASCAVGDFNCMSSSSSSSFSDLFDKPLEILKTLWNSIANVFSLVTFLISLLPSEMATFLFLGFTLAIVIGLIKMIL